MAIMQFEQMALDSLEPGSFALFTKTVSETDVTLYAGISADFSPVHMNGQYGKKTGFKDRVAHPMLIGSMAGGAVFRLLTPGSYCLKREFQTIAPVYMGDTVTVRAEVVAVDTGKKQVRVEFECYNQRADLVMRGESLETLDFTERG